MPSLSFHQQRRQKFLEGLSGPVVLFAGGFISRNYPANPFPLRVDSNFLYFFDKPEADAAALFDPADQSVRLFVHERTADDALWHGAQPGFEELKAYHGVTEVLAVWGPLKPIMAAVLHTLATAVVIFNSARLVRKGEHLTACAAPSGTSPPPQPEPAGPVPAMA